MSTRPRAYFLLGRLSFPLSRPCSFHIFKNSPSPDLFDFTYSRLSDPSSCRPRPLISCCTFHASILLHILLPCVTIRPQPPPSLLFSPLFWSFLLPRSRGHVLHAVARCHGGEHIPLGLGFARWRQNHDQGHGISSRHVGCQCVDCGDPVPSAQDSGQGDCLRA